MTLLVAGVDGANVWMVSDTAISGGTLDTRERENQFKIFPSGDGHGLVGFAGDQHHGLRIANKIAALAAGPNAVEALLEEHRSYPSVDFAYGFFDAEGPHLVRVSNGRTEAVPTLHIGNSDAFRDFQEIRHDPKIDFAPEAVKFFVCGVRGTEKIPAALSIAITSLLRLFVERQERDVGGWLVPYLLSRGGAILCGYGYSVSDPILPQLSSGSVVPHGTAEAGGYGLSFTEFGHGDGAVIYWLQRAGGNVFVKTANGFEVHAFEGSPTIFKQKALAALGRPVDLFFSDQPHGPVQSITVLRDEFGRPAFSIANSGNSFSVSVLNVETPFDVGGSIDFGLAAQIGAQPLITPNLSATLSEDSKTVSLALTKNDSPTDQVTVGAYELDEILICIGEARRRLADQVASQPVKGPKTREKMIVNPGWQTELPVHPSLGGVTLRLRHPGFGWLTFSLPHHEAASLGSWLSNATRSTGSQ